MCVGGVLVYTLRGSILLLDFGAKILHIFYMCKLKDVFS